MHLPCRLASDIVLSYELNCYIDPAKVKADARYDGKWVLRTNTSLRAEEVALTYKQLWQVEALFRTSKSLFETRPIFHQRDETIRGHVFCSFLALVSCARRYSTVSKRLDTGSNGPTCSETLKHFRQWRSSTKASVFACACLCASLKTGKGKT